VVRDVDAIELMEELIKDTSIPISFRSMFKNYVEWQKKNCRCCGCKEGHIPKCINEGE